MHNPREVFENPSQYWEFLTAVDDKSFEGQNFDRKEASRLGTVTSSGINHLTDQIKQCVSAFANASRDGGLLVLGISKTGEVKGVNHLNDDQRKAITDLDQMLVNQSAQINFLPCTDTSGKDNQICLIYVPFAEKGICETPGKTPKGWFRKGSQSVPLTQTLREQLCRNKRIVDFERTYCCPYDPADVDRGVLQEYRQVFLSDAEYEYKDEGILHQTGAIIRESDGYSFTNAGMLFFASNPQRVQASSYIRLLRFNCSINESDNRGATTFDRNFTGPVTKQIRDFRTFIKDTGFFKTYERRKPDGGFIEEPEYPTIAVDETIVNAVAHRDYAVGKPIECEAYKDALVVRNPGGIQQINRDMPEQFSLGDLTLESYPRNRTLIEWLRQMRDGDGRPFVRALSEGTRTMRDEMDRAALPAPVYDVGETQTTVTLFNNAIEREASMRRESGLETTEFANLFPLELSADNRKSETASLWQRRGDFVAALGDALSANGWYIDNSGFGRLKAHRRGSDVPLPTKVTNIVRFYPAYIFKFRQHWEKNYLCVDYALEVKNVRNLRALLSVFALNDLVGKTAVAQWEGSWHRGKIVHAETEHARVQFFDFDVEEQIPTHKVIPNLSRSEIKQVLKDVNTNFDFDREVKRHGLSLEPGSARTRIEKTRAVVENLASSIFPLPFDSTSVTLRSQPAPLLRNRRESSALVVDTLSEPNVEFSRRVESANIRDGITQLGAYDDSPHSIEIVPICTDQMRTNMSALIERLKRGKYKYRGSERTFGTKFTYGSIVTVPTPETALEECRRLLREHPEWIGNERTDRIFLVQTPEADYASDDETSPYYRVKRFLLEYGVPCQMVDTPTLRNPDWKDLNLALNIAAKCNVVPWVLPDAVPDADFFIGLSYTQNTRRDQGKLMGYANVFNEYGRWQFYSGNTETFTYEERAKNFARLVRATMERIQLSETPSIYFHYSAKFSREDREAMLEAARSICPQGAYHFVWINTHHNVRLYDARPETDGSLRRGSFVTSSPNQIFLSTTGYNPYRKTLGTPHMLEINSRTEWPYGVPSLSPDHRSLAVQILSLTKLNWASTDSLCAEPITTKYAGDIAYLTAAFLRQGGVFRLHPVLEDTPWFI